MLCDVCGKDFDDASNLRRHKLTHNAEQKSFKCKCCDKAFARSDHLKKHEESVHALREATPTHNNDTGPNRHECQYCGKSYAYKKSLQRHMEGHMRAAGLSNEEKLTVNDSEVMDIRGDDLEIDEASGPAQCADKRNANENNLTCPSCNKILSSFIKLRQHLVDEHEYKLDIVQKDFNSIDEFYMWKECMEKKEFCSFVNRRGVRNLKSGTKYYFECHRSGVFHSKGTGKRFRPTDKQTAKIGSVCPAFITLTVSNESVHMEWCREHFGHDCNINFLRLTETERNFIADRLKNGTSFDVILDDVRDSVETADNFTRFHLLDRRDLWNISRKVEFKHTHAHPNDAISVEILVETLKKRGENNPVKFLKMQGQTCNCSFNHCKLTVDDFMIVLCTPYQQTEFKDYLEEKVLIDSTHGTNDYDFQLTTLATVDSSGSGVPVMFCISSTVSTDSMTLFFEVAKDTLGKTSSTKVFMSDMAGEFYNAWKNIFGEAGVSLFCTWHVDKRWREKVKEKVKGLSTQAEVYRALISVRNILDEEWFVLCMACMRCWLIDDDDTKDFLDYFDKYDKCKEKWAYCYKGGVGLNTNMFVDALFKKLKYSYMKGKKLRRVDECLHILFRLARDVAFDRLRRKFKGNNSYRQAQIVRSHKVSDEMSSDWLQENVIEVTAGMQWRVKSFKSNVTVQYDVEFVDSMCCSCELVCPRCCYCVHEFKCTCIDNQIKGNSVVKVFCLEGEQRSEGENGMAVQDEIEAICETTGECKVGKEVQKADMWKPIATNIHHLLSCFNNADSVPDAVIEGGLKFLEVLRREMPQPVQEQPEEEASDGMEVMEVPETPARTRTPGRMLTPQTSVTPRRVSPQRRLLFHSIKKKPMKKKQNLFKPTLHQEGAFIANFAMGEGRQFVNIHTDFDHSYTKNDVDDTF